MQNKRDYKTKSARLEVQVCGLTKRTVWRVDVGFVVLQNELCGLSPSRWARRSIRRQVWNLPQGCLQNELWAPIGNRRAGYHPALQSEPGGCGHDFSPGENGLAQGLEFQEQVETDVEILRLAAWIWDNTDSMLAQGSEWPKAKPGFRRPTTPVLETGSTAAESSWVRSRVRWAALAAVPSGISAGSSVPLLHGPPARKTVLS